MNKTEFVRTHPDLSAEQLIALAAKKHRTKLSRAHIHTIRSSLKRSGKASTKAGKSTFFVDAVHGRDDNPGDSSKKALKSFDELTRRLGATAKQGVLPQPRYSLESINQATAGFGLHARLEAITGKFVGEILQAIKSASIAEIVR